MPNEIALGIFQRMVLIRAFEAAAMDLFDNGEIRSLLHLSIGQEAIAAGTCAALTDRDYITGNHRSHAHPIAKGSDVKRLMAELLGRRDGVCKGKGGSMHLADFAVGSLGESGIVGSAIPVATGAALSISLRNEDRVCVCFFGDGAVAEGVFHESPNLASVWKLPVIYVCENNQYAVTLRVTDSLAVPRVASQAAAYAMPGVMVDGQDAIEVFEAVADAVQRAKAGDGPSLIEALTFRIVEHAHGLKVAAQYRAGSLADEWRTRDPIGLLRSRLESSRAATTAELDEIVTGAAEEIRQAVEFARGSPFPEPQEAFEDLYAVSIPTRPFL